jgi:alkaline phosphatase
MKTGLVTCGDITDATPADFYAHQPERDNAISILRELKRSSIDLLMGSGMESLSNVALLMEPGKEQVSRKIVNELLPEYTVVPHIDSVVVNSPAKWVVIDNKAGLSVLKGRGDWLEQAFSKALKVLARNKEGFFLMTEGAQIDYGGIMEDMRTICRT